MAGGTGSETTGKVVDLRNRVRANANVAQLARQEITNARQALDCTRAELAQRISEYLDWEATAELIATWETDITPPGDVLVAIRLLVDPGALQSVAAPTMDLSGVEAVFRTRSEFISQMPTEQLLDGADVIEGIGLSHNLICQQYPTPKLVTAINNGTDVECLFLQPRGEHIAQREEEEGYPIGNLSTLGELNINVLVTQVRPNLEPSAMQRLRIGTYDETVRFNLIFLDNELCIFQPYLYSVRGLDTPTFAVRDHQDLGLYNSLRSCYEWVRARAQF